MEILVEDEADAALVTRKLDEPPVDEPPPAEGACGADASLGTAPPKAKRGRPVGSKNKVKIVAPEPPPDPESEPEEPTPPKVPSAKKARTRAAGTSGAPPRPKLRHLLRAARDWSCRTLWDESMLHPIHPIRPNLQDRTPILW